VKIEMTIEPSCPKCGSSAHFRSKPVDIYNENETGIIKGSFVFCGKCRTVINWIPRNW